MALLTFAPPVGPSPGTQRKPSLNILKADFGDGYSQPAPNGLNHIRDSVSLSWDALTETQMHAIYDFFVARGGTESFYYEPAGYTSTVKWTCEEFDASLSDGTWKVTATLLQSFTNLT